VAGDVRQLENVIERAMIATTGDTLRLDEPLSSGRADGCDLPTADNVDGVQRTPITTVLHRCGWRINDAGNAAERLASIPTRCVSA